MRSRAGDGNLLFGAVALGAFGLLLWGEHRRALRAGTERKPRRMLRNVAVAGVGAVATQLAERPLTAPLARLVERRGLGLVPRLPLPAWARTAVAVLLLDYTLYVWHVLLHRVPLLWRHHKVHHADLDLDASTALRFHAGELLASAPWRAAQIVVIGVTPRALALWQRLLLLSVMFHHSNLRLPLDVERRLSWVVMTPRLHGIHHSVVREEQDSNWSSGLTLWDVLHGTLRADVPQAEITIGVAAYPEPGDVTLPRLMAMPYDGVADTTRLPDGRRPTRAPRLAPGGPLEG